MLKHIVIGVIGGIGSGKSTVARAFSDLGCRVIDADAIAHEILEQPVICSQLVARWGQDIFDSNRSINRAKIAELAFGSKEELDFLNGLIHPYVLDRCEQLIRIYLKAPDITGIVLDMPLLVEVGWEKRCDFLIFVQCSEAKRWARIKKNGTFKPEELKKREKYQISLDNKKQIAHYIVHNNSDKSDIAEQVAQIFSSIKGSK